MNKLNDIYMLLDWNNSEQEQERGIELALSIKDLTVFFQPMHPRHNKNIWGNCAAIICKHGDDILKQYLDKMFDWLMDMNWPGAFCIFERLVIFKDTSYLINVLSIYIRKARISGDDVWTNNLLHLKNSILLNENS